MAFPGHRGIGPCFPQELVDIIIDTLQDHFDTLRACSTVCKRWTYRSRIHLLRAISFDLTSSTLSTANKPIDTMMNRFSSLQKTLSNSPKLRRHIRSIELQNLQWHNSKGADAYGILSSILLTLDSVERLSLQNLRWYNCPEPLQEAIATLLRRPALKQFELSAFAVRQRSSLIRLLTYPANLKVLHMKRIECRDYYRGDEPTEENGLSRVRDLETFYIDATHCSCLFDWLLTSDSLMDLTGLTSLHVSDGCRPIFAERLLRLAGPSLQRLELGIGYMFDSHLLNIHLDDLPCLHSLELVAESSISLIEKFFSGLQDPHPLENIYVKGATPGSGVCNWGVLDVLFTQPELEHLQVVEFQITKKYWDDDELEAFRDQFPLLIKNDILRILEI